MQSFVLMNANIAILSVRPQCTMWFTSAVQFVVEEASNCSIYLILKNEISCAHTCSLHFFQLCYNWWYFDTHKIYWPVFCCFSLFLVCLTYWPLLLLPLSAFTIFPLHELTLLYVYTKKTTVSPVYSVLRERWLWNYYKMLYILICVSWF